MVDSLSITLPNSWHALSEEQLRYLFSLLACDMSAVEVKTYCFIRWSGLKVISRYGDGYRLRYNKKKYLVYSVAIADAISALDWIDQLPESPVRIASIGKHKAAESSLAGVAFEIFLYCDNLYQGFLETQNYELLRQMAHALYGSDRINLSKGELISVFYWWSSLKSLLSRSFPHFLQPITSTADNLLADDSIGVRVAEAMNAQIRALTKGDITKEKEVLSMDTWRALTELNAQAKENEELNSKYGKN